MSLLLPAGAAFAFLFGLATVFRKKTPLFYKITVYGFGSYFLALAYGLLYTALLSEANGFHPGYLGYVGSFFFLFSSYFGALDRLADDGSPSYRRYRLTALAPCCLILAWGVYRTLHGTEPAAQLLLLPVAGTAYFACKHLLLPDVELGIIRVMRPYNAVILLLCLLQPAAMTAILQGEYAFWAAALCALPTVLALPLAYRGCKRWFM